MTYDHFLSSYLSEFRLLLCRQIIFSSLLAQAEVQPTAKKRTQRRSQKVIEEKVGLPLFSLIKLVKQKCRDWFCFCFHVMSQLQVRSLFKLTVVNEWLLPLLSPGHLVWTSGLVQSFQSSKMRLQRHRLNML